MFWKAGLASCIRFEIVLNPESMISYSSSVVLVFHLSVCISSPRGIMVFHFSALLVQIHWEIGMGVLRRWRRELCLPWLECRRQRWRKFGFGVHLGLCADFCNGFDQVEDCRGLLGRHLCRAWSTNSNHGFRGDFRFGQGTEHTLQETHARLIGQRARTG